MSDEEKQESRAPSEEERRKFAAEALKAEAEARKTVAEAAKAEIELETAQRGRDENLTASKFYRTYHYVQAVSEASVKECMKTLDLWHRLDIARELPPGPMEIVFTSPGGSVVDGMALFDHIRILSGQGHEITVGTLGMAASMAGILLQAGDHRWMGREAWILIHQVQAGMMGSYGELQDRMKWLELVQERILDIFAARAKQAGENGTASKPFTRAALKKNWERTDWWLDSDDALKGGVVDEVRA